METNLIIVAPPVAHVVRNLKMQYNQNHGTNAVATPVINLTITAQINGPRLPNLEDEWKISF